MKKNLLKTMLVATALTMGVNAWAQNVVYERGGAGTAWSSADLAAWEATQTEGISLTVDNNSLLISVSKSSEGGKVGEYTTAIPTTGSSSLLTYTVKWNPGNATGKNDSSRGYIKFGDVEFRYYGQNKVAHAVIGDTDNIIGGWNRNTEVTLTVTVNQATGLVSYDWGGTTGTGVTKTAGQFTSFTLGYGGTVPNWENQVRLSELSIVEKEQSVSTATYTVKFMCDGKEIKEASTRTGVVGESVVIDDADMAPIFIDDIKYVYKSGNTDEIVAADGSTVVTLEFREAEMWSYTITTSGNGDPLNCKATGSVFENGKVWVDFPRYQADVYSQVFEKKPVSNNMGQEFTITQNNFTTDVAYTQVEGVEHIFWGEGEYLFEKVADSPYCSNRMSSGSAGYVTEENGWITSLMPGTYQIRAGITGEVTFTFSAGTQTILTASSSGNLMTETISEEFTLSDEEYITVAAGGDAGSSSKIPKAIDYILITRSADITDGIQTVATQQQSSSIFNLQGQQVKQAQKGLYIIDGKKVMVK